MTELGRTAPQSAARERGVASFFADTRGEPAAARVCCGTSCLLAGGDRLFAELGTATTSRGVYCLGYCDRSPALRLADGRVGLGARALADARSPAELPPPSIRCRAREPIVTARIARGDFADLDRARAAGVYDALERALREPPERLLAAMEASGERGRGGAGFPTGQKWRRCAQAPAPLRVVVVNGDEGDPGSFVDRVLLERDPHAILEGMLLCAHAVRARRGIVFVRSEYPEAFARLLRAVEQARLVGLLGGSVLGSPLAFDVEVISGKGSYVCGEETALLNAIEGRRGEARVRPPYPAVEGLHGWPTVVNNVESLVNVPWIARRGADAYRALGTRASSGTKALCFNAGFERPGIVEVEFGASLRELIEGEAGGARGGAALEAAWIGGPMGSVAFADGWDVRLCYDALAERGIVLGHGGIVALPRGVDLHALLEHWLEFMAEESCGRCAPCRIGSQRALELLRSRAPGPRLSALLGLVSASSLCGFGQRLPVGVLRLLERLALREEKRT